MAGRRSVIGACPAKLPVLIGHGGWFLIDSNFPLFSSPMPDQDRIRTVVEATLEEWGKRPGPLLPILHTLQEVLGCIPESAVPLIASALRLSRAEVHGVISFYPDFRTTPAGRHVLRVCRAESCQAMGGATVEAAARDRLGIDWHQTTAEGDFTLEPVYCLGHCACSPAVMLDGEVHAHVSPEHLVSLIDACGKAS